MKLMPMNDSLHQYEPTRKIFSQRLKELREAAGMNQVEFAKVLGVARASISYYENGQRVPDIEVLESITKHFGTSADYLLGLTNERYPKEAVQAADWENTLSSAIKNALDGFFIAYNGYQDKAGSMDLHEPIVISVMGSLKNALERNGELIKLLSDLPSKVMTYSELDRFIDKYLDAMPHIRYGGHEYPDGSYGDGVMDDDLEDAIRDVFEENLPGYKEYRRMEIGKWIKTKREE